MHSKEQSDGDVKEDTIFFYQEISSKYLKEMRECVVHETRRKTKHSCHCGEQMAVGYSVAKCPDER